MQSILNFIFVNHFMRDGDPVLRNQVISETTDHPEKLQKYMQNRLEELGETEFNLKVIEYLRVAIKAVEEEMIVSDAKTALPKKKKAVQ